MIRSISCMLLCMFTLALYSEDSNKTPWLGIGFDTTTGFDARVVVKTVKEGSTAEGMGIRVKDIITDFSSDKNTWRISGEDDLSSALKQHAVGDMIRIGIERDGTNLTLKGALKERPTAKAVMSANDSLQKDLAALGALQNSSDSSKGLTLSMLALSKTLEQLPEKIEEAAREFKEVYPEGEFIIKVEISISSKKIAPEKDTLADNSTDKTDTQTETETEDKADAVDNPAIKPLPDAPLPAQVAP